MKEFAEEDCIALICNGEFDDVPGTPIGELFEEFFDNINYNVVKENDIFVDFTGDAFCDDEPCTILIRFKIDSNVEEFEIDKVLVNEDELNEDEVLDLLEDIAYVGGAVISEEYSSCSEESCAHCTHHCGEYTEEFDDDEDDDDNHDQEENDDEE